MIKSLKKSKKIKDSHNYNKELDKFYTKSLVVDTVIEYIKKCLWSII